jgi:hypothetical protein
MYAKYGILAPLVSLFVTFEIDQNNIDARIKDFVKHDIDARIRQFIDAKEASMVSNPLNFSVAKLLFQSGQQDQQFSKSALQESHFKEVIVRRQGGYTHYIVRETSESDLTSSDVFMKKDSPSAGDNFRVSVIYGVENKSSAYRPSWPYKEYFAGDIERRYPKNKYRVTVQQEDAFVKHVKQLRDDESKKVNEMHKKILKIAKIDQEVVEKDNSVTQQHSFEFDSSRYYRDRYDSTKKVLLRHYLIDCHKVIIKKKAVKNTAFFLISSLMDYIAIHQFFLQLLKLL